MVDHVGFRRYSYALQPIFKVVSRNTIKTDIMKIFEYERNKTMKLLDSNASQIALTTDMWTATNQKRGFMAITSHFIDVSWKLQSQLVRFIYVSCPHIAEVLKNALVDCLLDWNLDPMFARLKQRETGLSSPLRSLTRLLLLSADRSGAFISSP
ncbi:zinc finger BED domain-containing protein DAYSLEEPER-like [Zingiber officinale]|uniref:zinc finger BED domain-containing protein DAYSLEEPER-like n=1 Tax=Zingiber officinale TaxID=94328 RepID=UPI001C4AFD84|nr:zinc finger BED domain-containing protein DAYSLEEPER-like [Zingiber officinale]